MVLTMGWGLLEEAAAGFVPRRGKLKAVYLKM
jgi:hypothetical protein